ncbi:SH3 domain-containing protein [Maritalea mediterranea]|uniref:SH3 domain-containing protein n=1 Tax=Maritalea mediterranea TaxID=2909667 RepID=A0ABS9E825_9HYPH|nr:SH3 domain-containing protein [Maritalea mediterranea]MCF4099035.1 SH3 domain-containing protein [Maritalea mediterranea]
MSLRLFVLTTSLALAGMAMFTSAASAFPASSKTALNVRSGPGTEYRVVDALYAGERVNVERCTNSRSWCYITHTGPDGWVSAKYLQRHGGGNYDGGNNGGGHTGGEYQARATTALNVRSGPSTHRSIVDALYEGERVTVERCRSSWCYITHNGPDGWVAKQYLARIGGGNTGGGHQGGNNKPNFSIQFGSDGEFSFSFGNLPPQHEDARACFYSEPHYRGRSFCLDEGESVRRLRDGWNDEISSMRVFGDVDVTVCEHARFRGFCRTVDRSYPRIGPRLDNEISSIRVH